MRYLGPLLEIVGLKLTGGSPGAGKVLTSDADGDATWQDPPASEPETPLFIGPDAPDTDAETYLWIETGLGDGSGFTMWIEDGEA